MELDLYNRIANELQKSIVYPVLVIFLQSETDRLMYNIEMRARDFEKNIDFEYIDNLNQVYCEYFFRYDKSPLLIINSNEIDFVNNDNDLDDIVEFMKDPIEGTKYFNPVKNL